MAVQIKTRLLTLDEYERIIDAGVFSEDERIELIKGAIVDMAPIGLAHMACVARLTALFSTAAASKAIVWPQNNAIRVSGNSRPEPDLCLLRWRDDYYASRLPEAADVMLVVEVADTSLKYDRGVKGPLYAEAGIPQYWLVNLSDDVIEVYEDPSGGTYKLTRNAHRGDTLDITGEFGSLEVTAILGEK